MARQKPTQTDARAIRDRLEQYAKDRWGSWYEFERSCKIPRSTGSGWRHPKTPSVPETVHLVRLARKGDLNPTWLLTGRGSQTLTDERVSSAIEPWEELTAEGARLAKAERSFLDAVPVFGSLPREVRATLAEALIRCAKSGTGPQPQLTDHLLEELARELWQLVVCPLARWGLRRDLDPSTRPFTRRAFSDYALAMLHALMLAMPNPGMGRPFAELASQAAKAPRPGKS